MNRTTLKEKSMKKWSLVTKEAVTRQHQYPRRPNHTHNKPNNFHSSQSNSKQSHTQLFAENLGTYTGIKEKAACIRYCEEKTRIQEVKDKKMIRKGKITPTGHYQEKIPPCQQINREIKSN